MGGGGEGVTGQQRKSQLFFFCACNCLWDASACVPTPLLSNNGVTIVEWRNFLIGKLRQTHTLYI
jgi:hypothetical protein